MRNLKVNKIPGDKGKENTDNRVYAIQQKPYSKSS